MVILDWQIVEGVKCFIVHLRNMLFQLLVPLSFTALLMLEPFSCTGLVAYLSSIYQCRNLLADVGIFVLWVAK